MRLIASIVGLALLTPGTLSGQSLRFVDTTADAGIALSGKGHGVAVRDYDRDGWPDLFIASSDGPSALFRNRGDGTFEDVTAASGIDVVGGHAAPAWADIDNDGWADLAVVGVTGQNKLYRARGDGTFEDITAGSGIDPGAEAASLAFGDYDGDGLVDLFLAVDRGLDLLYRNRGDATFEDVSTRAGIAGPEHAVAMQATWFDYDHDGSQDLFVVHDGTDDSRLHKNQGFLPIYDQGGVMGFADVGSGNSMGMAIGDVDGDGWEDVYVTRIGEAGLYLNQAGQGFLMADDAMGAWRNGMAWGTVFSDFDNDRDLDLFVVNTSGYDGTPTLLYENRNAWFYDRSQSAGASFLTETQGLAAADLNLDGLMDLVLPGHGGTVRVLMGAPENPGNWARLQLQGLRANRDAIGARVETIVDGQILTRWVSGGDSFCSQSEPVLHFGLGDAAGIDRLVVHWGQGPPEAFGPLTAGETHLLTQGSGSAVATDISPLELPQEDLSLGVFPNPFMADTNVMVHLAAPQHVRLSVFDAIGRRIAVLTEGTLPVGPSEFVVRGMRRGVYFIHLETDRGSATKAISRVR